MKTAESVVVGIGGALLALAIVWLVVIIFRKGSHATFITWRPFALITVYAVCIPLLRSGIEWATSDPERAPFVLAVATSAVFFGIASAVWLTGFFFGRWRRERRSGILSGRR
jgi:hypothetical protein